MIQKTAPTPTKIPSSAHPPAQSCTPAQAAVSITPITLTVSPTSEINIYQITLHIHLEPDDWIYHDYITLSCDSPNIILSAWQPTCEPVAHYINSFKETKRVYTGSFSITTIATISDPANHANKKSLEKKANVHLTYYKKYDKKITHHLIPLILSDQTISGEQTSSTHQQTQLVTQEPDILPAHQTSSHAPRTNTQEIPETAPVSEREQHAPVTHYQDRVYAAASHTAHRATSYTTDYTSQYTTQYKTEVHSLVIIMLIVILSALKQKNKLVSGAQNIALFILVWCYYAMAEQTIPAHTCWLITATLTLCIGILAIRKAEAFPPALFSKRAYRYLYYFVIITGMGTLAGSLIVYAKAAQAYYMYCAY